MAFSADSSKLFLATLTGAIQILDLSSLEVRTLSEHVPVAEYEGDLSTDDESHEEDAEMEEADGSATPAVRNRHERRAHHRKRAQKLGVIRTLALSHDQQYLLLADEYNHLFLYNLDTMSLQHTTLPTFKEAHLAIEFHPENSSLVAILCARSTLYVYDCEAGVLTDYTKEHLMQITSATNSTALAIQRDQFLHLSWDRSGLTAGGSSGGSLLLQSLNHLLHVHLDRPKPREGVQLTPTPPSAAAGPLLRRDRKRKMVEESAGLHLDASSESEPADPLQVNFRLINRFRPMLYAGFINEIVAPETLAAEQKANRAQLQQAKAGEKKRKKAAQEDAATAQAENGDAGEPGSQRPVLVGSSVLVIEAPWLNILQQLPQPMARHRYGT